MSEVESERVMDEYDTDKDGKIQLKEYLKNPVFETSKLDMMIYDRNGCLSNTGIS